jgi:hypothetical protein
VHFVLSFLPCSAGLPQTVNLGHYGQATDIPSTCSSCKWSQVTIWWGPMVISYLCSWKLKYLWGHTMPKHKEVALSPWSASHWFSDFWRSKSQVSKDVKLYNKMFIWVHCDKIVPHKTVGTIWGNIWQIIYLWRKVVCFVCTNEIHQTGMLQIAFLISLESSQGGGVHGLGFMAFGLAVQKF